MSGKAGKGGKGKKKGTFPVYFSIFMHRAARRFILYVCTRTDGSIYTNNFPTQTVDEQNRTEQTRATNQSANQTQSITTSPPMETPILHFTPGPSPENNNPPVQSQ